MKLMSLKENKAKSLSRIWAIALLHTVALRKHKTATLISDSIGKFNFLMPNPPNNLKSISYTEKKSSGLLTVSIKSRRIKLKTARPFMINNTRNTSTN